MTAGNTIIGLLIVLVPAMAKDKLVDWYNPIMHRPGGGVAVTVSRSSTIVIESHFSDGTLRNRLEETLSYSKRTFRLNLDYGSFDLGWLRITTDEGAVLGAEYELLEGNNFVSSRLTFAFQKPRGMRDGYVCQSFEADNCAVLFINASDRPIKQKTCVTFPGASYCDFVTTIIQPGRCVRSQVPQGRMLVIESKGPATAFLVSLRPVQGSVQMFDASSTIEFGAQVEHGQK